MSSNLRTLCKICGAGSSMGFFEFDWKAERWNLIVALGAVIGGYMGANFLSNDVAVAINPKTIDHLNTLGFKSAGSSYLPSELFDLNALTNVKSLSILSIGGLLVGKVHGLLVKE